MFITGWDFVVFLPYFLLMLALLYTLRRKIPANYAYRKYYIPAFIVKVVGAVAIGLIYQYFYGYGDTFGYYNMGKFFTRAVEDNPGNFFKVFLTGDIDFYNNLAYQYGFRSWHNFTPQTVIVARFSAFFGLISGGYYLPIALFFALISFFGVWSLYKTFLMLFPKLYRELAWFILFLPSLFFWGSGLLKDSLSVAGLGVMTWYCYRFFIEQKRKLSYLIWIVLSIYLIFLVKAYILLAFFPAILTWIVLEYRNKIRIASLRKLMLPFSFALILVLFGFISNQVSNVYEGLSLENITSTASTLQSNISIYKASSSYSIGTIDGSFGNFIRVMFPALGTTFFRPFPWEVNNVLSILTALESLFFLWYTFMTFRRVGIKKSMGLIFSKPIVLFCFTFAMIFGIAVGITSENLGTLARYKIPCLPFYLVSILLVNYYATGEGGVFRKKYGQARTAARQAGRG